MVQQNPGQDPQLGSRLVGVENLYVLYIAETCIIWPLAAAEQLQKYIQT